MSKKPKKKYVDQMSLYAQQDKIGTSFHAYMNQFERENDPVKHPQHYTSQVPGVECKDVIGWFPGHVAAAMKYLWRHQQKGRPVEDLRKAIEFIQFEIDRLEQIEGGE